MDRAGLFGRHAAVLLERGTGSRNFPAQSLRPGSAEDSARQAASVADIDGRVDVKELAFYHAVAGWAQCGRLSESA